MMALNEATRDVVFEVHCPADIYQTLRAEGYDRPALGEEARQSLAVKLYCQHRLSMGKASAMADLPIVQFMDLLRSLNLPVVEYGEEEYAQDLETMAHLLLAHHKGLSVDVKAALDTMRSRGFRLSDKVYQDIFRRVSEATEESHRP